VKPDFWALVAACLLGIAVLSSGLAMFRVRGLWGRIAAVARVAGMTALLASLVSAVVLQGEWSPFDLHRVVMDLALAMLVVHFALAWRLGTSGANLAVDVTALLLVVLAAIVLRPGSPPLTCVQRTVPFWIRWFLFLLGSGGVLVAGNASLMLALRRGMMGRGKDLRIANPTDLCSLLTGATFLALVAIGGGLTIGVWWAWQTVGGLSSGDPREGLMAVTWLVSAMSLSAWQLGIWRGRWAAGLAIMSAGMVLVGLLAVANGQLVLSI
jgi:hypothetical protein